MAELHTPDEELSLLEQLHFGEELYFSMVQCNSVLELYFSMEMNNSVLEQYFSMEMNNSDEEQNSFYLVQNDCVTVQTDLNCVHLLFLAPARSLELQELT